MARQHPDDPGMRGDLPGQLRAVRQTHRVQERDADRNRWMVQADERRYAGALGEGAAQPGHLPGTQAPARRTGHPRVQDHDRERRVLDHVRRPGPSAQEARPVMLAPFPGAGGPHPHTLTPWANGVRPQSAERP
ncbi:hypothetical protein ACF08E_18615 [Streptomyces globisporus]|uniref:hypothetical protein n=1 Tax=Streptomyces globisporus TaxID=1908 RepID=UPI0036FEC8F2